MKRMLWRCAVLAAALGLLGAGTPGAQDAARGVAVRALEAERGAPIYRSSWALVIGINRYPQGGPLRPLNFAVADARAVQRLLIDHYGVPEGNVTLLLDEQATKQAILNALTDLADHAGPDDRVIVYFSGHGHTVDLPREGKRGYLVPADARLTDADLAVPARVERQCVPMTEVRQKSRLMEARHTLFLIDACYSGLAISGRSARAVPYHLKTVAFRPMLSILAAGSAGEEAQENPELGHGAFTKKLLDGLTPVAGTLVADTEPAGEPDGVVTLKELAAFLCTAVPQITGGKQNPVDAQEDEGQMLFFPANLPSAAPPPAAAPAAPPAPIAPAQPVDTTARIRVTSVPPGATVLVDGIAHPQATPCTVAVDLGVRKTGQVEVAVSLDGYRAAVNVVSLARGQTSPLDVSLQRLPPAPAPQPPPLTPPPALPTPGGAGQTWTNPKDGMEFVFVPAGEFTMGEDDDHEKPAHKVNLPGYWIGKYEVTVGQFRKFVQESGHRPEGAWEQSGTDDRLPVVFVSWNDAVAYCQWAGVRLPTEAEWEKAARGTDGRIYPWGNEWDSARCNTAERLAGRAFPDYNAWRAWWEGGGRKTRLADALRPVGSYPAGASPYGCLDMAGNVWEWCSSVWEPYPYRADDGRENTNDNSSRVFRGGCWHDNRVPARAAYRTGFDPTNRALDLGFRAARSSNP